MSIQMISRFRGGADPAAQDLFLANTMSGDVRKTPFIPSGQESVRMRQWQKKSATYVL